MEDLHKATDKRRNRRVLFYTQQSASQHLHHIFTYNAQTRCAHMPET